MRFVMSAAQRGLWLLDRLHPGTAQYNVPFTLRLRGPLDVVALSRAFDRVVARHPALRTVFPGDGLACPAEHAITLDVVREDRSAQWAREPFDLAAGPLVRARLVRLGPEEHLFAVVMHHIVCDLASIRVFFDDLAAFYAGAEPAPLPEPPREEAGDLEWWRSYLEGAPTVLDLPADRPRPPVRGTAGATFTRTIPAPAVAGAAALARTARTSTFTVMLAAYAALLGRLSGQREVLIGTPFSSFLEPHVGFHVTTLPVRADLAGDPDFVTLTRRVRDSLLEVLGHREVGFDALVEHLRPARDPSRTPLVQAMLTFEAGRLAEPRFPGLVAEVAMTPPETAKFDLDFMIHQGDGEDYALAVTYSTELFSPAAAGELAGRFVRVLKAAVAAPDTPVRALPVLTSAERAALIVPASPPGGSRGPAIHELIAERAAATPDAPALDGERVLTYADLDRRSAAVAHRLAASGAGPEDVVGILMPRGADYVTAMLGVLRSGAAYLPLDPAHPEERRQALLAAAGARHVVTEIPGDGAGRVPGGVPGGSAPVHPENLAYTIFTSGSTGAPKGVGVTHGALANHAHAIVAAFELTERDRVLQFAAPGFDVAAEELYPTWLAGGCVVMLDGTPAPAELSGVLAERRVTVANLPSGYWRRWDGRDCPLRLMVIGSEAADPEALARWRWNVPLIHAYGLTETTITATLHRMDGPPEAGVPVGAPIAGLRAYVLDEELEPALTGELYLAGAGLARGYTGAADRTAERFVPDPYGPPGSRMHRTGDRARRRPGGPIEVLGRIDEQLKVHGHRIEPAEVEAVLAAHPEVEAAAVALREDRLVGYIAPAVPPDFRTYLAARLPAYLTPTVFLSLAELPVTAGGKLDRRALPTPSFTARSERARTELERDLAAIWAGELGLASIGIHDNFFDLGGTSYTLAAVHARVTALLDRPLALVTLYEFPTVAALSAHLTASAPEETPSAGRLLAGRARLRRRRTP
ncbi:amino acid adenylation domain-containing protein [Nonomuraea typhae]|uniref:Amino acid adenylation domain-containing protein n=1 Tax=Nonomuraea typhae TaxID=2603600 RepID=A0ABW7YUM5_9ACTN